MPTPWQKPGNSRDRLMSSNQLEGILYLADERQDGQLRDPEHPGRPLRGNFVVPRNLIRDLQLRTGLLLKGEQRGRSIGRIEAIEGRSPDEYAGRANLYDSTALDPQPGIRLEHDPNELTTRIIDMLAPVGFGQRGLIVAPPRIGQNHPPAKHRQRHPRQLSQRRACASSHRRTPRRSHRHEAKRARAPFTLPATTTRSKNIWTSPSSSSSAASARWSSARTSSSCWIRSPASAGPSTPADPAAAEPCPADSTTAPWKSPSASSAPPEKSKTAAASPSSPHASSTPAAEWIR